MLRYPNGLPTVRSEPRIGIDAYGGIQNTTPEPQKPKMIPSAQPTFSGTFSPFNWQMRYPLGIRFRHPPYPRLALHTDSNGRANLAAVPYDSDATLIEHVCIADVEYSADQMHRVVENQMEMGSDDIGGFIRENNTYERTRSPPFDELAQSGHIAKNLNTTFNSPTLHLPPPQALRALQPPPPRAHYANTVHERENEDEIGLGGSLHRDDLATSDHSEPEHPEEYVAPDNSSIDPSILDLDKIDPEMLEKGTINRPATPTPNPNSMRVTKIRKKRGRKKRITAEPEPQRAEQQESCWMDCGSEIEDSELFKEKSLEIAEMLARGPLTMESDTDNLEQPEGTFLLSDEQFIAFVAGKPLQRSSYAFLRNEAQLEVLMQLEAANRLGYKHENDNVYVLKSEDDERARSDRSDMLIERGMESNTARGVAQCGGGCPKVCKTYMDLAVHIDKEHSQLWRPWKCNVKDCVFQIIGFHKGAEARRHYRTSHAQVSSCCRLCARAYARTDALRRHYRTRHMRKPKQPK